MKYCTDWKAVALTHYEYPEDDAIGHLLAWFSLAPIFIVVGLLTLILFRRDIHTIVFTIGLPLDDLLNTILKKSIRQPRPNLRALTNLPSQFGMPSSHSQFMAFFSVYLILFLFIRVPNHCSVVHQLYKYGCSVLLILTSIIVAYSRIYLLYHTVPQVIFGLSVGAVAGSGYYLLVDRKLYQYFAQIACHPVGEFLMLRDYSLIPHSFWFEYTSALNETRTRLRRRNR